MSNLGYENDPYAAQTMFVDYQSGQDVGDLGGSAAGELVPALTEQVGSSAPKAPMPWDALIGGATALATTGISLGMQSHQIKKARQHEKDILASQAEIAALQAETARLQQPQSSGVPWWGWALGGTAVVGLIVGTAVYLGRRQQ